MNKKFTLVILPVLVSLCIVFAASVFAEDEIEDSKPEFLITFGQRQGNLRLGLTDKWVELPFVAKKSGTVFKVSIKAGTWSFKNKQITCKVTDHTNKNISIVKKSAPFNVESQTEWRDFDYTLNPFELVEWQPYKLWCKGPDYNKTVYWIYKEQGNEFLSKNYIISMIKSSKGE